MKRNFGILLVLFGIGFFFVSMFLSTGYQPSYNIIGNISRMEIVIKKGTFVKGHQYIPRSFGVIEDDNKALYRRLNYPDTFDHYEGRITIPLGYMLSISVVLILTGSGLILISPKS